MYKKLLARGIPCGYLKKSTVAGCSADTSEAVDDAAVVTSVNAYTKERSRMRLHSANVNPYAINNFFSLPKDAIEGLKCAVLSCSRNAKQLQHEADQLGNVISQRNFPAQHSVIEKARAKVREKLGADGDLKYDERFDEKINEAQRYDARREVSKYLRKWSFNWKPLTFESREGAAAYFLSRFHINYAEVRRVLQEFRRVDFTPQSVLDYGSGTCSVFWAANDMWGSKVQEYQCIDPCDEMNKFAMDVLRGSDNSGNSAFVHPNINFRRYFSPTLNHKFDLVVAHRVFVELASHDSRIDILSALWARTNRYLVLIDSSTESAFDALISLRDYIIEAGFEVHLDELRALLSKEDLLNDELETILEDKNLSELERYYLLREKIPNTITLPTRLEPGHTFAPCPHDQGCPKITAKSEKSCKFLARCMELRADGKKSKTSDGTMKGTFCYFILEKGLRPRNRTLPRLLKSEKAGGQISCQICTPFNGIQNFVLSKKNSLLYKSLKARKPEELLPLEVDVISSESQFDIFKAAVEKFDKRSKNE